MDDLEHRQARHFRDDLRSARAAVLADAEAFDGPFQAVERLGRFLNPEAWTLKKAFPELRDLAKDSPLSYALNGSWPEFHRDFEALFETFRDARNDVMHVGAKARHLTSHAVEVCLILEDALQKSLDTVADFMVSDPVCVETWQPVSLARHRMLEQSFTFLPIVPAEESDTWRFLADHQLAQFLGDRHGRMERLSLTIEAAIEEGLGTSPAELIDGAASVSEARKRVGDQPLLVKSKERVLGIITAFDLL